MIHHAAACGVPVRLLHRPAGSRRGGLGSAVVAGARHARGEWVLVMDGDLQHPPETAAVLAGTAMRHDSDIVVGTRYVGAATPLTAWTAACGPWCRPGARAWSRECSRAASRW